MLSHKHFLCCGISPHRYLNYLTSQVSCTYERESQWRMSRILVGIILILITSRGIPVPSLAQEPTDSKGNVKSGTKTKLDLNAQEARRLNVVRVKAFADRAFGFQDLKLKTLTLSQLADVLWVDDEAYARQLFVK